MEYSQEPIRALPCPTCPFIDPMTMAQLEASRELPHADDPLFTLCHEHLEEGYCFQCPGYAANVARCGNG